MDAAVGRTGPGRDDRRRLGSQPVQPLAGGDRLSGVEVVAEGRPVAALGVQLLIRDGPFHHQHERLQLAAVRLAEPLEEVVGALLRAAFEVDQRPVHGDLGKSGKRPEGYLLDAWLGCRRQGHGITVATEPGIDPQDVDQSFFRFQCSSCRHRCLLRSPPCGCGSNVASAVQTRSPPERGALPAAAAAGWEFFRIHSSQPSMPSPVVADRVRTSTPGLSSAPGARKSRRRTPHRGAGLLC